LLKKTPNCLHRILDLSFKTRTSNKLTKILKPRIVPFKSRLTISSRRTKTLRKRMPG